MRFVILCLCLLVLLQREGAAQSDSGFAAWARQRALPIDSAGRAFAVLDPAVRRARLIGVGESKHGIHQFLDFRFQLLRSLVRRHRVTALLLESGLPEGMALDAYLTGRTDSIRFDQAISYGFGTYQEVREAVAWLRDWNRGPGRAHPVRAYGVDLANSAGSILPALDRLTEQLGGSAPEVGAAVTALRPLAERAAAPNWFPAKRRYDSLNQATRDSLRDGVDRLVALAKAAKIPDPERARWAERLALVAQQTEAFFRLGPYQITNPRDVAMAANTLWALERLPAGERAVLWAHNAHVQRVPIAGPPVPNGPTPSMGTMIAAKLGTGYLAIGTAYGGPSVDSASAPLAGSVDQVLGTAAPAPFLLSFDAAPTGAAEWLAAPRPIRFEVGHLVVVTGAAFGAIAYFERADPARAVTSH